ncbi:BTB domain-containing protein [Mycena kentingensis (nom. inval.)]|nr:BTB domain-containing protein [Mycena kentingensis (nom. inval.)]
MPTEERPAKRAREDSSVESTVIRSPDYWFEDGSIILQAETTQFRVVKSVLAIHSTVFRDMFSVPLPADEPLVEGCPVVFLPGDKAGDWKHLLDAMYPQTCFPKNGPSIEELSALLRLSKKYDIASFRKRCIECLKSEFPTTLEAYDAMPEDWEHLYVPQECKSVQLRVHVANLSREVGLHSVLPGVLYGLVAACDPNAEGILSDEFQALNVADQLLCFKAFAKFVRRYDTTPLRWLAEDVAIPCDGCEDPEACEEERKTLALAWATDAFTVAHILDSWDHDTDWQNSKTQKGLCDPCLTQGREIHQSARAEWWIKLPSYFDLPPWEELLKMDLE